MSHKHSITDPGHSHSAPAGFNAGYSGGRFQKTSDTSGSNNTYGATTGITVQGVTDANAGKELRPNNYTNRIWVRVS